MRLRVTEKEFFTLLEVGTSKFLYPIKVEGDDAMELRNIDEELDLVAYVAKEVDVLQFHEEDDLSEEHVLKTPRLPRPRPSHPEAHVCPKALEYPTLKAAIHPKDPAPFVILWKMWEELKKSQEMVFHALNTNGRKIERIRRDHV